LTLPKNRGLSTASSCLEATVDLEDLEDHVLWDVPEAARRVSVSPATIYKWVERGHLEVEKRDYRGRLWMTPLALARAERKTRERARRTVELHPAAVA
jgi:IS30 family transposase